MPKIEKPEVRYLLEDVLSLGFAIVKNNGFVSVNESTRTGKFTTGTEVAMMIAGDKDAFIVSQSEADETLPMVMSIVDFIDEMELPKNAFMSYIADLKTWFYLGSVPKSKIKLVVSSIGMFLKAQEEKLTPKIDTKWLGEEGTKISVAAKLISKRNISTRYGDSQIVNAATADGGMIVWFTTGNVSNLTVGKDYQISGKVKKLDEFRGTKQTILTRAVFNEV